MLSTASQSLQLTAAMAAGWGVLAVPAYLVAGWTAVEGLAYGALLCLLPGVLLNLRTALVGTRQHPFSALLLGMGLRLAVVLMGALVICVNRPDMRGATFLFWLVPLYCVALAIETRQALRVESAISEFTQAARGSSREQLT